MVMALKLTLPDGRRKVVDLPPRADPEAVADAHGAVLFDLCESAADARLQIALDPNGRADSL